MTNLEETGAYCRQCISHEVASDGSLICKHSGEAPEYEEECELFQEEEEEDQAVLTQQANEAFLEDQERITKQMLAEENLPVGVLWGLVACLIGAVLWGLISYLTNYQIGYMAIAMGFIVGMAMRMGKGVRPIFGVVGAALALLGCVLGDYLSIIGYWAEDEQLSYMDILFSVNIVDMIPVLIDNTMSMTALFYVIALFEGYKLSFRDVECEE